MQCKEGPAQVVRANLGYGDSKSEIGIIEWSISAWYGGQPGTEGGLHVHSLGWVGDLLNVGETSLSFIMYTSGFGINRCVLSRATPFNNPTCCIFCSASSTTFGAIFGGQGINSSLNMPVFCPKKITVLELYISAKSFGYHLLTISHGSSHQTVSHAQAMIHKKRKKKKHGQKLLKGGKLLNQGYMIQCTGATFNSRVTFNSNRKTRSNLTQSLQDFLSYITSHPSMSVPVSVPIGCADEVQFFCLTPETP